MTEDEAKQKWCPFSGKPPTEYSSHAAIVSFCIASECMAWRKLVGTNYGAELDETGMYPEYEEGSGYCGLADRP